MIIYGGKATLKNLFLHNLNWWNFYNNKKTSIRNGIKIAVTKLLSCRNDNVKGYYKALCYKCGHYHVVRQSCKCKLCSSCGKKATEIWLRKAFKTFPPVAYHHITLTMPKPLWVLFWLNRDLFSTLMKTAGDTINKYGQDKEQIKLAIFLGLHTFGSALNKNVHIHLSTSAVGITNDLKQLKKISFDKPSIMKMWRYAVINMFRNQFKNNQLKLPDNLKYLNNYTKFNAWLDALYKKKWILEISKKHDDHSITTKYIGKYIKRPAIGDTRIIQFDNEEVKYQYKDHHTNSIETKSCPIDEFIGLVIQHIPDKHFRMIRYYGILANRVRRKLLAKFFELLNLEQQNNNVTISYRQLFINTYGRDPLVCPYCKIEMEIVINRKSMKNNNILLLHDQLSKNLI